MPRDKRKKPVHKAKQRRVKRYQKAREDCQLAGDIETVPVGAARSEVVDPATQGSQPLPGLIGRAVREDWSTPAHRKPQLVDELIGIVTAQDDETDDHVKVAAARVLIQADQLQWERDNPELAGKTKGGTKVDVHNTNTTQVNLLDLAREAAARPNALDEAKRKALEKRDAKEGPVQDQADRPGEEAAPEV